MGHKVIMTCVQQGGRKRPQRKCSNCLMETTEANTRGTIDVADCFKVGGLLARLTCSVSNWTPSRKLFGLKKKKKCKNKALWNILRAIWNNCGVPRVWWEHEDQVSVVAVGWCFFPHLPPAFLFVPFLIFQKKKKLAASPAAAAAPPNVLFKPPATSQPEPNLWQSFLPYTHTHTQSAVTCCC